MRTLFCDCHGPNHCHRFSCKIWISVLKSMRAHESLHSHEDDSNCAFMHSRGSDHRLALATPAVVLRSYAALRLHYNCIIYIGASVIMQLGEAIHDQHSWEKQALIVYFYQTITLKRTNGFFKQTTVYTNIGMITHLCATFQAIAFKYYCVWSRRTFPNSSSHLHNLHAATNITKSWD